jgi:hypothetical protein
VFLQAPAIFEGKRAAWLIDGKAGDMIAEFYAPVNPAGAWQDSDPGNCTYRDGHHGPSGTSSCTWSEYLDQIDQM